MLVRKVILLILTPPLAVCLNMLKQYLERRIHTTTHTQIVVKMSVICYTYRNAQLC
jgi:hypothetical protein